MHSTQLIKKYIKSSRNVRFFYIGFTRIVRYIFLFKKIHQRIFTKYKILKIEDIKSWSQRNQLSINILNVDRKMYVNEPNVFDGGDKHYSFSYGLAELPEVYLAKLKNVVVLEGSDFVISDPHTALYDELAFDKDAKYGLKIGIVPLIQERNPIKNEITLKYRKSLRKLPNQVIHFCKDYSYNYFHWIIECLPRMWIIEQFEELNSLPLLIDSHLNPQQLESLKLLTENKRELIPLKLGHGYKVENLIYPSDLSVMHNNYSHQYEYDKDILISPLAIQYLRTKYFSLLDINQDRSSQHRKIYLSRKKLNQQQRLVNTEEIETKLLEKGFEIIYPELLSFTAQVKLFSQAEIIVGAAGSAFANLVFAPKTCKVFVLCTNNRFNPYLFTMITSRLNCQVCHVVGKEHSIDDNRSIVHRAFKVDIHTLEQALKEYC